MCKACPCCRERRLQESSASPSLWDECWIWWVTTSSHYELLTLQGTVKSKCSSSFCSSVSDVVAAKLVALMFWAFCRWSDVIRANVLRSLSVSPALHLSWFNVRDNLCLIASPHPYNILQHTKMPAACSLLRKQSSQDMAGMTWPPDLKSTVGEKFTWERENCVVLFCKSDSVYSLFLFCSTYWSRFSSGVNNATVPSSGATMIHTSLGLVPLTLTPQCN